MLLATIAGLAALPTATASAESITGKTSDELRAIAAAAPAKRLDVVVQLRPGVTPATGRALIERAGGRVVGRHVPVVNGHGASLPGRGVVALARHADVRAVSLNGRAFVTDTTSATEAAGAVSTEPATGTDNGCPAATDTSKPAQDVPLSPIRQITSTSTIKTAWQASTRISSVWSSEEDSATGLGIGVAVLDTGISGDLADFRQNPSTRASRVIASAVVNPCAKDGRDGYGHGTHVAGLIAGNGFNHPTTSPVYGKYVGAAPEANLISIKVADEDGGTSVLDVLYGIQFAVDHKTAYGIRVLNMSLSSTVAESYKTDPIDAAVEAAWAAGIVVVAAAGNDGAAPDAVSYAPGNDPFIISVGGVDDRGTSSYYDDVLASWSSRGVTQDGIAKPEVVAPGAQMPATLAPGSDFASACPTCVVDGSYFKVGGTSMAAAVVSGAVALMLEDRPTLTPDQVKTLLVRNANAVAGTREIDVDDAVDASRPTTYTSSLVGGLPRNTTLLDPLTGTADWARATWRRATWRSADGTAADAGWSRATWRCDCSKTESGAVDSARATWRRATWRRTAEFGG